MKGSYFTSNPAGRGNANKYSSQLQGVMERKLINRNIQTHINKKIIETVRILS